MKPLLWFEPLNALGKQNESIVVKGPLDAGSPLHFNAPGSHGHVGVQPDVHSVTPGLLGCITGCVGGLLDGGNIRPPVIDGNQADACAYAEQPFLMHESKIIHAFTNLLRDLACLVSAAMFQKNSELIPAQPRQCVARAYVFA